MRLRALTALTVAAIGLLAAGCGEEKERQDAGEPAGEFPVEVVAAKFPLEQRLAQTSDLELEIENVGEETLPALAVTIYTGDEKASAPFSIVTDQPNVADPNRPVWILEHGYPKLAVSEGEDLDKAPSAGAAVAQTDTFSFGALAAEDDPQTPERENVVNAIWRVTPVQAGTYTVHYEIAAGLTGRAEAVTEDGGPVTGEFVVTITDKPPKARVNAAGDVVIQNNP